MTYDDWKADVANREGSAPCDEDPATDDATEPQSCDACGHPTTIVRRVGSESLCDECATYSLERDLVSAAMAYGEAHVAYSAAYQRWVNECPEEIGASEHLDLPGWKRIVDAACDRSNDARRKLADAADRMWRARGPSGHPLDCRCSWCAPSK